MAIVCITRRVTAAASRSYFIPGTTLAGFTKSIRLRARVRFVHESTLGRMATLAVSALSSHRRPQSRSKTESGLAILNVAPGRRRLRSIGEKHAADHRVNAADPFDLQVDVSGHVPNQISSVRKAGNRTSIQNGAAACIQKFDGLSPAFQIPIQEVNGHFVNGLIRKPDVDHHGVGLVPHRRDAPAARSPFERPWVVRRLGPDSQVVSRRGHSAGSTT